MKLFKFKYFPAAQRRFKRGLCISVSLFNHFKCLNIDNHFYLAVFKAIFVNFSILVAAVLTRTV
jgi:hypothetical protein